MNARYFTQVAWLTLCLLGVAQHALAADIRTWAFEATVISVDDPDDVFGDVRLGDPAQGTFSYDLATAGDTVGPEWVDYFHPNPFQGMQLAIDNPRDGSQLRFDPAPDPEYLVSVFSGGAYFDGETSALAFSYFTTPPRPGISNLVYADITAPNFLTDTALPTEINLDDWAAAAFYLDVFAVTAQIHTLTPIAAGDFDLDGSVDDADLRTWESEFGSTGVLSADGDRNGSVDGADFLIWQANVGAIASTTLAAPEPASILLLIGSLVLMPDRRRQHILTN